MPVLKVDAHFTVSRSWARNLHNIAESWYSLEEIQSSWDIFSISSPTSLSIG
jgi:hypothetical protein